MIYLLAFLGVMVPLAACLGYAAMHDSERRGPRTASAAAPAAPRRHPVAPAPPTCPVSRERQVWIESSMLWLVKQFGLDTVRRPVALPTPDFFPVPFSGERREIRALLTRVCKVMQVDPLFIWMRLFDGPDTEELSRGEARRFAVGLYLRAWDFSVISLDRMDAAAPAVLAATIAHELGHVRLLGEDRITTARKDHEQLTDLATVYLGMGVFTANAALTSHHRGPAADRPEPGWIMTHGYLSQSDLAYALACCCRLRGETREPAWAEQLKPAPRRTLVQGLAYLAHAAGADDTGKVFPTAGHYRR
ncbi:MULTISPECIES: hypothetical protein [Streptacidiphilus]|uniref:Peptidase n=1 Tax=Streptacidiphilus cavernicola TaxID=3342716 RepID=A0ABV6UMB8_9ACTN|nr:hypothetical protein [Streptacidiphilus jeojiense]